MVTVYVDILIILNAFVNFFILLLTSAFSKETPRTLRIVIASFAGALFSLYIFLPSYSFVLEAIVRLACSAVSVFICFGKGSFIRFIRLTLCFYAVSFMYAGVMLALWFIIRPESMAINNGIVYLDISPLLLVSVTLVSYTVLSLIRFFGRKNGSGGEMCGLKVKLGVKSVTLHTLIDTGHNLRDELTGSPVVIVTPAKLSELLGDDFKAFEGGPSEEICEFSSRYRMIPCKTVGGSTLLKALRCDSMTVHIKDTFFSLSSPVLAMSEVNLGGDYDAIASPDILSVRV